MVRTKRTSGQVLTLVAEPRPAMSEVEETGSIHQGDKSQPSRGFRWVRFMVVMMGLLLLCGAVSATAVLVYQQAQQKRVGKRIKKIRMILALDTHVAYTEVARTLRSMLKQKPNAVDLMILLAETEAVLWSRYNGGTSARKEAERLLEQAKKRGASRRHVAILTTYLLLYDGHPEQAALAAERALVHFRGSPKLRCLLGLSRLAMGDLDAAEATLRLAMSHNSEYIPAKLHLALVQRLRGQSHQSLTLLREVLMYSPGHLGAQIEIALVRLELQGFMDLVLAEKLAEKVRLFPEYHARAELLLGRIHLRLGNAKKALKHLKKAAMLRPSDPVYTLSLMEYHLMPGGDVVKAKLASEGNQKTSREYPTAACLFARLALMMGNPQQALRYLTELRAPAIDTQEQLLSSSLKIEALSQNDDVATAEQLCNDHLGRKSPSKHKLASLRVLDSCIEHALRHSRRHLASSLVKQAPDRASKRLYLGALHLIDARPTEALKEISKVDETRLEPLLALKAQALLASGRPRAASKVLRAVLKHKAGSAWARMALSWGLLASGRRRQALSEAREIEKLNPEGIRLLYEMGRFYLAADMTGKAHTTARKLVKEASSSALGHYMEGLTALRRRRWKNARESFKAALKRALNHYESKMELACLALKQGDDATGRLLFFEAYKDSGKNPLVYERMARAFLERKNIKAASHFYLMAAGEYKSSGSRYLASDLFSRLAEILSEIPDVNRKKVEALFKRSLRGRYIHPMAYLRRARHLKKRGKDDEALIWFRKAAASNPELLSAHFELGWLLVHKDTSHSEALKALNHVVRMDGRSSIGQRARKWLNRLNNRLKRRNQTR